MWKYHNIHNRFQLTRCSVSNRQIVMAVAKQLTNNQNISAGDRERDDQLTDRWEVNVTCGVDAAAHYTELTHWRSRARTVHWTDAAPQRAGRNQLGAPPDLDLGSWFVCQSLMEVTIWMHQEPMRFWLCPPSTLQLNYLRNCPNVTHMTITPVTLSIAT